MIESENTNWAQYFLYIETTASVSSEVSIEIWLGSRTNENEKSLGALYFDEIKLEKIDRAQFVENATNENSFSNTTLNEAATNSAKLLDGDVVVWTHEAHEGHNISSLLYNFENTSTHSGYVLFAQNTAESENEEEEDLSLVLTSQSFKLSQFGMYRIRILAKATTDSASVVFKLSNGTSSKTITTTLSSTTTNNTFNNFSEYVFYARTGYLKNENCTLSVTVGKNSSIMLDDVKIENVSYSTYTSGTYRIDFMTGTSDMNVTNGNFKIVSETYTNSTPIAAYSWNNVGDTATCGIIPLASSGEDCLTFGAFQASIGATANPGNTYEIGGIAKTLNTCYVIASEENVFSRIQSSPISLASSSTTVAKISVLVKTEGGKATVSLYSSSTLVAQTKNIEAEDGWVEVAFYIKPQSSMSLTLELSLGSSSDNKSSGIVYFASASCDKTITENSYDNKKENPGAFDSFWDANSYYKHNGIISNGVYEVTAANYTFETETEGAFVGILDLSNIDNNSVFADYTDNLVNTENEAKGEFLALFAENGSISVTHAAGDTNTKTGYIKITLNAKVLGTASTAKINLGKYGTFNLSSSNDWQTIEIYVRATSTTIGTITPVFEVSGEQKAIALFDEIEFETIDEKKYKTAEESALVKKVNNDSKDEEQSTPSKSKNKTNGTMIFFVVLSSVLLVGAVLAAVIARMVKRLPKRTVVNIPQQNYKRKQTSTKSKSNNDKGFV